VAWRGLRLALRLAAARRIGLVVGIAYLLLYLWLARQLIIDPRAQFGRFVELPGLSVSPQLSLADVVNPFRNVVVVYLTDQVALQVSLPLFLGGLLMGVLVALNTSVAVTRAWHELRSCRLNAPFAVLTALPGFLSAFSCCAPTLLFLLGANFAVAVVSIAPIALPLAIVVAGVLLAWSASRIPAQATATA
jgi:hypothetical protein